MTTRAINGREMRVLPALQEANVLLDERTIIDAAIAIFRERNRIGRFDYMKDGAVLERLDDEERTLDRVLRAATPRDRALFDVIAALQDCLAVRVPG